VPHPAWVGAWVCHPPVPSQYTRQATDGPASWACDAVLLAGRPPVLHSPPQQPGGGQICAAGPHPGQGDAARLWPSDRRHHCRGQARKRRGRCDVGGRSGQGRAGQGDRLPLLWKNKCRAAEGAEQSSKGLQSMREQGKDHKEIWQQHPAGTPPRTFFLPLRLCAMRMLCISMRRVAR
jgi:hypothetical protein